MGFTGRRVSRLSRNLPSAVSQPSIVTENLSKEVALGRVAGPFPSPPLPNFQVSPIGLVPKKHTAKFRTIFHLSFPKSGETSINSSISKEDFRLQYITIDNAIQGILRFGQGSFLQKQTLSLLFVLFPFDHQITSFLGCIGRAATTMIIFSPLGEGVPPSCSTYYLMQ